MSHKYNTLVIDNLSAKFYKILCVGRTLCKFHIGWNSPFNLFKQNEFPYYFAFVCAFVIMLNVPVNNCGHVGRVSSLNHTCFPGQASQSGYPVLRADTVA